MPPEGRRVVRRPQPAASAPAAAPRRVVRRPAEEPKPLVRQPPFSGSHGVDPEQAKKVRESAMRGEPTDNSQPYCTCRNVGGYGFDAHIGVYLHVACYKPSKAYYQAALQARVLVDPFNFKEQSSAG